MYRGAAVICNNQLMKRVKTFNAFDIIYIYIRHKDCACVLKKDKEKVERTLNLHTIAHDGWFLQE